MAWTAPTTRSTGELITASIWNTDVVNNLAYLKASPTFDGVIGASTAGTHTFTGAAATDNRISLINTTSGTTAAASFKTTAGTSNVFLFAYSQGYTTATYEVANGGALLCTTAGGLSIACTAGSSTVRVYAANTLSATFAAAGVTIPGTLGVTGTSTLGVVTGGLYNGQTITSAAAFTGSLTVATTLGVTGDATFTAQALAKTGTVGSPSFAFSGDTDAGIYLSSAGGGGFLQFAVDGVSRAFIGPRANAGGEVTAVGGAAGTGAIAGGCLVAQRNTSGNGAAGTLSLFRKTNVQRWLWVDDSGSDIVRIGTAAPTEDNTTVSDTSGTVVGTQTSTRASKDIHGEFTDNEKALGTLLTTPLYRFRYKSGAYNNQEFVGITTDDSPEFGMDKGRSFNPVNAFGFSVAAFKAMQHTIDTLTARLARVEQRAAI